MVLHHVAQRASGLIKPTAFFHAQFFGDGDLDVGNVLTPPQWFKQGIAKTQGKEVLYRRLAQVVIDPEHLVFTEHLGHTAVDGAVAGEVMAQRLFQHHAGLRRVEPGSSQLLDDGGEQRGRGGQVHHHGVGLALRQLVAEVSVMLGFGQVHADKFQQTGKALELLGTRAFGQIHLLKAAEDQGAVTLIAELVAADADDACTLRQGAVFEGLEQRGHQFAPGQVAGAAKEDKVKTHMENQI